MRKISLIFIIAMVGLILVIILFFLFFISQKKITSQFINKIPTNTFFMAKIDSWSANNEFEKYLAVIEEKLKGKYKLNFKKDFLPLIPNKFQILVLNSPQGKKESNNYILIIPNFSQESSHKLESFKKVVLEAWSRIFPVEKWKALPDGSLVVELIAKPENFSFEKIKIETNSSNPEPEVFFLSDQRIDFDWAYSFWEDKLILGTSKEAIIDVLKIQMGLTKDFLDLSKIPQKCYLAPREFIYLKESSILKKLDFTREIWEKLPEENRSIIIYLDKEEKLNYCYY